MTSVALTVTDSATMLRRNLKHQLRYPSLTLMLAGFPIVFLLLFVYVFGGQLGSGLGGGGAAHGDRGAYLTYVVPGILIVTVASAALGTAISVASDMTGGIIDRFRTMAITRAAVLTGHVVGSLLQTLAVLALVTAVALAIGFRANASALEWLAAAGILLLFAFALIRLSAALGLAAKSVETASNTPMFRTLLPFLSAGFVPTYSRVRAGRHATSREPRPPGRPARARGARRPYRRPATGPGWTPSHASAARSPPPAASPRSSPPAAGRRRRAGTPGRRQAGRCPAPPGRSAPASRSATLCW